MKNLIIGLLLATISFPVFAQESPCHDVRLTTDYLKTYGFSQKWVGTVPGKNNSLFVFQDTEGHWSLYMLTLDQETGTPVMCPISAGDKGLVTEK